MAVAANCYILLLYYFVRLLCVVDVVLLSLYLPDGKVWHVAWILSDR